MSFNEIQSTQLNDEIQWGIHFQKETKNAKKLSISPKSSPLNLQFIWENYQITKQIQELEMIKNHIFAQPVPKHLNLHNNKLNRVDRSAFTKKQYINFLATPHKYTTPSKKTSKIVALRRKFKRKHKCTARLIELSKPTKLQVYQTWKDYQNRLPAEVLERLDALLRTDHTLDPSFARCCFKDLDRKRKKEKYKRLKRRRMISNQKRRKNTEWLKIEVDLTVELIIDFLQQGTPLNLNYKQTLISNSIIDQLLRYNYLKKKPMRNSNKAYQRSLVDVVDQLSVWMDTILRYIDVQCIESEHYLEPSLKSLLSVTRDVYGEDDEEEIYSEEEEEVKKKEVKEDKKKGFKQYGFKIRTKKEIETHKEKTTTDTESYGTSSYSKYKETTEKTSEFENKYKENKQKIEDDTYYNITQFEDEKVSSKSSKSVRTGGTGPKRSGAQTLELDVGEEEATVSYTYAKRKIREFNDDSLTKLIDILSKSSPNFLEKHIDELNMPGVTYEDILDKVKHLQDKEFKEEKEKQKNILEKSMVEWAKNNEPDQVNEKIIETIQSAADIISDGLKKEGKRTERIAEIKDVKCVVDTETSTSWDTKTSNIKEKSSKRRVSMVGEDSELSKSKRTSTFSNSHKQKQLDTDQDVSEISSLGCQSEVTDTKNWSVSEPESDKTHVIKFTESEEGEERRYQPSRVTKPLKSAIKKKKEKVVSIETKKAITKAADVTKTEISEDIFGIIPKHKPSITYDHAPDTICCLTIKVWASWLLEVANNAQKWSEWLNSIIKEIKHIASVMRGEVLDDNGNTVMFYRDDWRAFVQKVEDMIISWRQYSMHVKDLTDKIINNFHGKRITCCPKCLEDNLIVNIAVAHDISQQLAEAMNTASYWRRWLDSIMMETVRLTSARVRIADIEPVSEISSFAVMELIEIQLPRPAPSEESIYEIEEYEYCQPRHSRR